MACLVRRARIKDDGPPADHVMMIVSHVDNAKSVEIEYDHHYGAHDGIREQRDHIVTPIERGSL